MYYPFRSAVRAIFIVSCFLTPAAIRAEPPAIVAARTDINGDLLPNGAVARLGTVRYNHGDTLNALHFTPNGKTIISEGRGHVRFWDSANGRELGQLDVGKPTHDDQTALSPDGKTLTMLSQDWNDTIRLIDIEQRKEIRTVNLPLRRNEQSVERLNALSPDGNLCALHTPKGIRIYDITVSKELYQLPNSDQIRAVTFAGADRLVTAGKKNQHIDVWDARSGKPVRQLDNGAPAEVLTASADGRLLAVLSHHNHAIDRHLDKDTIHIWDLATGTRKYTLDSPPKRWYLGVWFSPDGQLVFTHSHNPQGFELTVWDARSGARLRDVAGVGGKAFAVSPDGRQFATGGNK